MAYKDFGWDSNKTHGKRSTYKCGCRCEKCTRANREYHRPRMRERYRYNKTDHYT